MGCAMRVQDSYYSQDAYSTSLRCIPQNSDPALQYTPPSPSVDGSYAMQSSYDSLQGCIGSAISEYTLYLENFCFNVESQGYSYKFAFPSVVFYPGLKCSSNKPQTQALPTTCAAIASGDDYGGSYYDYYSKESSSSYYDSQGTTSLYSLWSELRSALSPSAGPSFAPFSVSGPEAPPTSRPSSVLNADVVMNVEQLINGVDLSTYYNEKQSSDLVLKSAIAKTLSAITPDNIAIKTIKKSNQDQRRSLRDLIIVADGLDTEGNQVLSYKVSFNTVLVGMEDPEDAYNSYLNEMNAALTTDKFDNILHHYAALMHVSNLQNAHTPKSSKPIISSTYTYTRSAPAWQLPSAMMISVIAVVLGIMLTILIAFFMRRNKYVCCTKASDSSDYGGLNANDSQHPSEFDDSALSTQGSMQKRVYKNIFRTGRKLSKKLTRPRGKKGRSMSTSVDDLEYEYSSTTGGSATVEGDLELVEVTFGKEVQTAVMNPLNEQRTG